MLVQCIYDQGTSEHREDGLFMVDSCFGVLDGVSAPYAPIDPVKEYYGMSGGALVSRYVERCFYDKSTIPLSLEETLSYINGRLKRFCQREGLPINDAGRLPGTTFAIVRIGAEVIELVQAGDCFVLWEKKNGDVSITHNQVRAHDTEMNAAIERIQREIARDSFGIKLEQATDEQRGKIRGEMWNRFYGVLIRARREDVNNTKSPRCYGLLNGQKRLLQVMEKLILPRKEIRLLLLFSDGMIPWSVMKSADDLEIGQKMIGIHKQGGLPKLLAVARGEEEKTKNIHYISYAEATAIAIEF